MLALVFYSALITFIIYYTFAKTNHLLNKHALMFTTVSIEFLFITECLFGEFIIVTLLVSTNFFFSILFFGYVCFFLLRMYRAYMASSNKDLSAQ